MEVIFYISVSKFSIMKEKYLFPNRFKMLGWFILIPASIIGLLDLIFELEPEFLTFNVPAFFIDEIFGQDKFVGIISNNLLNEIIGILIIIGALLVAFSREKIEDEFISRIRLDALVWAVYINYGILLITMVLIYDISFYYVMLFNMFTILIIFIIRFNWKLSRLKKPSI